MIFHVSSVAVADVEGGNADIELAPVELRINEHILAVGHMFSLTDAVPP